MKSIHILSINIVTHQAADRVSLGSRRANQTENACFPVPGSRGLLGDREVVPEVPNNQQVVTGQPTKNKTDELPQRQTTVKVEIIKRVSFAREIVTGDIPAKSSLTPQIATDDNALKASSPVHRPVARDETRSSIDRIVINDEIEQACQSEIGIKGKTGRMRTAVQQLTTGNDAAHDQQIATGCQQCISASNSWNRGQRGLHTPTNHSSIWGQRGQVIPTPTNLSFNSKPARPGHLHPYQPLINSRPARPGHLHQSFFITIPLKGSDLSTTLAKVILLKQKPTFDFDYLNPILTRAFIFLKYRNG